MFTFQYPAFSRISKQNSYYDWLTVVSYPATPATRVPYDLRGLHFHPNFLTADNLSIQIKWLPNRIIILNYITIPYFGRHRRQAINLSLPTVLALNERQTASSRIGNRDAVSISCDDNRYTTSVSIYAIVWK